MTYFRKTEAVVDLLKTGVSPRGTVFGPMGEVVRHSLQHLSDQDVAAMAGYLKSLPQTPAPAVSQEMQVKDSQTDEILKLGAKLYDEFR